MWIWTCSTNILVVSAKFWDDLLSFSPTSFEYKIYLSTYVSLCIYIYIFITINDNISLSCIDHYWSYQFLSHDFCARHRLKRISSPHLGNGQLCALENWRLMYRWACSPGFMIGTSIWEKKWQSQIMNHTYFIQFFDRSSSSKAPQSASKTKFRSCRGLDPHQTT